MKNKWFTINEINKTFISKKVAKNLDEAFDKSLHKWSLIEDGYATINAAKTCGLCDLYNFKYTCNSINDCPLGETESGYGIINKGECCIPFGHENPDLQILYMLFVREAIK